MRSDGLDPESSEAQTEPELRAKTEELDQFLPYGELIPFPAAFEVAKAVASELGVTDYKTETLLVRALRKEKLTEKRQGLAKGTLKDWLKNKSPEPPQFEYEEFTSERAIRELFKRKAARRRQLDRERKRKRRAKSQLLQTKNSKNNCRTIEAKKRTGISKKRTSNDKNRTRQSKKRKPQKARNVS
jgi:hypothetical protein